MLLHERYSISAAVKSASNAVMLEALRSLLKTWCTCPAWDVFCRELSKLLSSVHNSKTSLMHTLQELRHTNMTKLEVFYGLIEVMIHTSTIEILDLQTLHTRVSESAVPQLVGVMMAICSANSGDRKELSGNARR
jgi:hypothetical protein